MAPAEAASPRFRDLVPEDAILERISHGHIFTEGPVWNAREGALYFNSLSAVANIAYLCVAQSSLL